MTIVMRDTDLTLPIDEAADTQRDVMPEVFVATETFAMPDGSIEVATKEATARWLHRRQREENMAMLFYYMGRAIDQQKRPGVPLVLKNDRGAPLSVEEIVYALQQLAKHPVYSPDVRVETHSHDDGTLVVLDGGTVSVGAPRTSGTRGRYAGPN